MIVDIKVRREDGRYQRAASGEFAEAALRQIIDSASISDGWWFLRLWIGVVCLKRAERNSGEAAVADKWIRRYQAIRGIE